MKRLTEMFRNVPSGIKWAFLSTWLLVATLGLSAAGHQNVVVTVFVSVLSISLILFATSQTMALFTDLGRALAEISKGSLDVRFEPRGSDRGGQVVAAFNDMVQTIRERELAWTRRVDASRTRGAELENALREQQSASEAQGELLMAAQRLTSPAVPVFQGMIVLPLIGQISEERAGAITNNLLSGIETYGARVAIVDMTGVVQVDEPSTLVLLRAAQAAELMGCQPILTGLRPEFAQALVKQGSGIGKMMTRGDLEDGIRLGLAELGLLVGKRQG